MSNRLELEVPYWQRTLDSFADETIAKCIAKSGDGYYAALDFGPFRRPNDPNFTTFGKTLRDAVSCCADAIRADFAGVGPHAPHFDDDDFHQRLARHWAWKEKYDD